MRLQQSNEKLISSLLSTINPKLIADDSVRQMVELLLNLIEELNSKVIELSAENQRLKDENNRLKGEQGKPNIKAKKPRGFDKKNYSSEMLGDIDISISAGHLSNLLIKNHQGFETEKDEICEEGLASSPWQHLDLAQCEGRSSLTTPPT